jgi:hypothetical protein
VQAMTPTAHIDSANKIDTRGSLKKKGVQNDDTKVGMTRNVLLL